MKNILLKISLLAVLCVLFGARSESACAQTDPFIVATLPVTQGQQIQVASTLVDGEPWLFLPAHADLASLSLSINGSPEAQTLNWAEIAEETEPGVFAAPLENTGGGIARHAVAEPTSSLPVQR